MAQFFGLPGADRVKARPDVLAAATFKTKVEGELKLHRFEVVKMLGKGAYGVCHLVLDTATGEEYVVKSVDLSNMREKERKVALAEAQILAKLNNPNIVAYYGAWIEETILPGMAWAGPVKCLHILLEYCDGGELAGAIKKRKLAHGHFSENRVLVWFTQLTSALTYLHAQRILHRDLKTQNVFLKGKGRNTVIKLGDFGVAKTFFAEKSLASTAVGTPIYMAPELFTGEAYSYRSDIWSMGCILYEMCALKHAFTDPNGSLPGLIAAITSGRYDPIPAHYSDELRALVTCMLKRDTKERPSCAQLVSMPILQKGLAISLHVEQEKGARAVRAAHKVLRTHSQRVLVTGGVPAGGGGMVHSGFPRPGNLGQRQGSNGLQPLEGVSEEHEGTELPGNVPAPVPPVDYSDEDEEYGWNTEDEEALMEQEEEEGDEEEGDEEEGEEYDEGEDGDYDVGDDGEQVWSEGDLSFEHQGDFYGGLGNDSSFGSVPSVSGTTDPALGSVSQAPSMSTTDGGASSLASSTANSSGTGVGASASMQESMHRYEGVERRVGPEGQPLQSIDLSVVNGSTVGSGVPPTSALASSMLSPGGVKPTAHATGPALAAAPTAGPAPAVPPPAVPQAAARAHAQPVASPLPAAVTKAAAASGTPSSSSASAATKPSPQAAGRTTAQAAASTRQPGVVYAGSSAQALGAGAVGASFGIVGQKAPVVKQAQATLTSPVSSALSPAGVQRGTGRSGTAALPLSPAPTSMAGLASPTGVSTPATAAAARTSAAAAPPVAPPKLSHAMRSPALQPTGTGAGAAAASASPRRIPTAGSTTQATPSKSTVAASGSARKPSSVLSPSGTTAGTGSSQLAASASRPASGTGTSTSGVKKIARSTLASTTKSATGAAPGSATPGALTKAKTGVKKSTVSGKAGGTKAGTKKGTGKSASGTKGSAKKAGDKAAALPAGSAGSAAAMDDLMAQVVDLRAAIQEVEVQEAQDAHDKQEAQAQGGELLSPDAQSPRAVALAMAIGIESPDGVGVTSGVTSQKRPSSAFGGVRPASAGMRPGSAAAGKRTSLGRAQLELEAAAVHLEIAKGLQNLAAIAEQAEAAEGAGAPLLHMMDAGMTASGSSASDVNSSLDSSIASLSSTEEPGIVFSNMFGEGTTIGSFATPRPVDDVFGAEAETAGVIAVAEDTSATTDSPELIESASDAPVDARQHHTALPAASVPHAPRAVRETSHGHSHAHGHGPPVPPPQPPAHPHAVVRGRSTGGVPAAPPPLPPVHLPPAADTTTAANEGAGQPGAEGEATPMTVAAGGIGSTEAGSLLMALHDRPVAASTVPTSAATAEMRQDVARITESVTGLTTEQTVPPSQEVADTISADPAPSVQLHEKLTAQVGEDNLQLLNELVEETMAGGCISDTLMDILKLSPSASERHDVVTIPKEALMLLVQLGALHGMRKSA